MGIAMVETMKWENGKLILLDQTKLPVSVEWISCDTYQRVGKAIQKLEVQRQLLPWYWPGGKL